MSDDLKKKFKKESKEFERLRLKSESAQIKYDDSIGSDLSQEKIDKLHTNLDDALAKEDEFVVQYARKIFDNFKVIKPTLIHRRDKLEVSWDNAFGTDFDKISPELKGSIVALVEENGGQYRIK
jgi:hypothetical protein